MLSRQPHTGMTMVNESGGDGALEPPRPLAAILRNAKRANSPATTVANSPQPRGCNSPNLPLRSFHYCCLTTFDDSLTVLTTASLLLHHSFTRPYLSQLHHRNDCLPIACQPLAYKDCKNDFKRCIPSRILSIEHA